MSPIKVFSCLPLLLMLALPGCSEEPVRTPDKYLIPQGYIGFIKIDYDIKGAPLLPLQNGFRVYRIPLSGYFKTSSGMGEGWAKDEFYYVNGKVQQPLDGNQDDSGMVWDVGTSLFIGTHAEFQLTGRTGTWFGPLNHTATKYRLIGRDLSYRNLDRHNLPHINLVGAILGGTGLEGANLEGANLMYSVIEAHLEHTDLRGANLREADILNGTCLDTDFRHADMRKAQLHGVDLQHAKLAGADLRGVKYDGGTKWPHGFNPKQHGAFPL